ncbi:MAG TPA: hypothetical protein VFH69_06505 [Gemmatimonadota bacterium]|nr:hypothetical protein [Gemmatimonadota bacterium]
MFGKYPILVILAAAGVAACSTGREEVNTTAEAREAEARAAAAGESRVEMTKQYQSWRVATNPPGNTGPNAEGIVRGGAEATTIHIDLDSGEPGATYPWHIHSGECADSQPPVVGSTDAYPPIQVGDDGEGDAEATIAATLDPNGDYIVNVHLSPTQLDSIVSCGELVKSSSPEY